MQYLLPLRGVPGTSERNYLILYQSADFQGFFSRGVTVFTIEPILIPPEYKERGLEDQPFNFSLERPADQLAFRGEIDENN